VVYAIAGATDLAGPWEAGVTHQGGSDTPPLGSRLPDLTGTDWQYHTFSAFNGLPGTGFIRVAVDRH
jgi:hypothetical protein